MYHAPGAGIDAIAPARRRRDARSPPRRVDGLVAAGEESQPDFGARRVERLAEELALAIGDRDDAWLLVRFFSDVASVDPGVALLPALGAPSGDLDRHRSGRSFAASRRYVGFSARCDLLV